MVKIFKYSSKYAFTMIELIFAIVVIAISVMSLPMITQVTSNSIENNLAQEAIFQAVSEINIATTYIWDENSLNDASDIFESSRVINGTGTDCNATTKKRTGHVNRRCLENSATGFTSTGPFEYSLDASTHDYTITIDANSSAANKSATGYKKEYESKLDVTRCNTAGNCVNLDGTNNSNIKEIKVTIRELATQDIVTVFRAYSANIGEVDYHDTKNYPGGRF